MRLRRRLTKRTSLMQPDIKARAQGRWRGILMGLGFDRKLLSGKHGACPICDKGIDRFRWDDREGRGTYICSTCGAGNGVDLVMNWKHVDFVEAKRMIEGQIGTAPLDAPRAVRDDAAAKRAMTALWTRARPLDGQDVASRYLRARGLALAALPPSLKVVDDLPYSDGDREPKSYPAMLAKFVAPDDKSAILHRTYLAEPGVKAPVETVRKMMAGLVPAGGAVRLSAAEETMGVAEGIETAMSAAEIWDVPVWAALNSGALTKFKPPKIAKHIIIFADSDSSFGGQNAGFALAYRLKTEGFNVEVRTPMFTDTGEKSDWNDMAERKAA